MPNSFSRLSSFRRSLRLGDRQSLAGMAAVVVILHVVGVVMLLTLDRSVFTIGVGLLVYTFGLRHAFDADHIAAVDNTTRKLMTEAENLGNGRRPLSVGFWFALGHSTVVFALCLLLSMGVKALAGQIENGNSILHSVTGIVGPSVSGVFLYVLGALNLVVLIGIVRVFGKMRAGSFDEAELETQLQKRGFMNRFVGGLTKSVRKPWHIYPIGVLFGLGFDTATEVGLLVVAGGAATVGLPFYAILVLPILFAAGMCLMDTIDGIVMNLAYGWAYARPVRKVFYNISVTSISVAVALVIGTFELVGVIVGQTGETRGPLAAIANIPLDYAGYGIAALFVLSWLVSLAIWRFGKIEERWTARVRL
ncbi:MAG: high-affinity nickel transport protein [Microbacteriaceae bacterium]|jgi:high-affinity nickel-transport protein|nr:high-affinity nickel transport protein [Microbacteriaceae bacterium]